MPDLTKFVSEFKHGFQQGSRFLVQIFVRPEMVTNIIAEASLLGVLDAVLAVPQAVKWLYTGLAASAARMPDRGFGEVDLAMYGITEHFPYHAEYTKLGVTFLMPHTTTIASNDNGIPRFFNFWQNQIQNLSNGPESGADFRFPSFYYATILLTLLDKQDKGTISYQFDNCYPSVVDSVPISWATPDFIQLPVQFTFSYFKVVPHLESLAVSTIDNLVNKII